MAPEEVEKKGTRCSYSMWDMFEESLYVDMEVDCLCRVVFIMEQISHRCAQVTSLGCWGQQGDSSVGFILAHP